MPNKDIKMPAIPSFMLRALYQRDSLRITGDGFQFEIRNEIAPVRLTGLMPLKVDGKPIPLAQCSYVHRGEELPAMAVSAGNSVLVHKGESVTVRVRETPLRPGRHSLDIGIEAQGLGQLRFTVSDRAR